MLKTTKTINTLKDNAIKNEDSKMVKGLNLISTLIDVKATCEVLTNKVNGTEEYLFKVDNDYSILYQPNRNEIILRCNNSKYMEVYTSKTGYSICTRGYYLLKVVFKDTKKDEALKNILTSNLSYHPKYDMKHVFKNLPLDIATSLINKFYKLDHNSKLTENAFVKKDEDLGSKKSIYLINKDDEESEEE